MPKSKVMEKWQTVIPKEIREAARIEVGDILNWKYDSGRIYLEAPKRVDNPSERLFGLVPYSQDAVKKVRQIRRRRMEKIQTEGLY